MELIWGMKINCSLKLRFQEISKFRLVFEFGRAMGLLLSINGYFKLILTFTILCVFQVNMSTWNKNHSFGYEFVLSTVKGQVKHS